MEKKNLSQQTADRLYNMIVVERRLAPGEKLPNEVDLARELGVSRTTLREALHALASRNILEVRRGRGTFVSPQVEHINDFGFSDLDQVKGQLRDLFELRRIFEPPPPGWPVCGPLRRRWRRFWPAVSRWTGASGKIGTGPRRIGSSTPPSSGPPTTSS